MAQTKSPDDWKKEGVELKKTFKAVKNAAHKFGLTYADKGMCLVVDRRKNGATLFKEAKKMPGAKAKGVFGEMEVNGSTIVFKYDGDLPSGVEEGGLSRKFKEHLKLCKVPGLMVEVKPMKGDEDKKKAPPQEAEEQEASTTAKAQAQEAPTEGGSAQQAPPQQEQASENQQEEGGEDDPALKAKLLKDIDNVEAVFKVNYEGMDEKDVKELEGAINTIRGAINSDDLTGAQNMMNKLQLLTGVGPDTPAQPGAVRLPKKKGAKLTPEELKKKKKELTKKLAGIKPDLQQTMVAAQPEDQKELSKLAKGFGKLVKTDKIEEAEETFGKLESKIEELKEAQEKGAKPKITPEQKAEKLTRLADIKSRLTDLLKDAA